MPATPPFHYAHSGLTIASAFELPEWQCFAGLPIGAPDVAISVGAMAGGAARPDGEVERVSNSLEFAIDGIARWRISEGRIIKVQPFPDADWRGVRLFTLGSAWAALGYQRGFAVWHGSVVARGGRALLLCGAPGEGKSTLAAALAESGWVLVADDLSRVEAGAGGARVYPSSDGVRLWREAIAHLGWQNRAIARDWLREDKYRCAVPRTAAGGSPVPLAAVVVLETGRDLMLERLSGSDALAAAFRGTLYRPGMLDALQAWGQQANLAAQIVRDTPVFRLTRPRDLMTIAESRDAVAQLVTP